MLSTIIITKNEEFNLKKCIHSILFSDEVIVIDNDSHDDTKLIAQKYQARIIEMPNTRDFSELRNRGWEEAKSDWILFIDADEIVSNELSKEILQELIHPKFSQYYLKRRDHWWGRVLKYGEVQNAYTKGFVRLIKKGNGTWKGSVHEVIYSPDPYGVFENFIEHYPHPSLKEFIFDINQYSSIRAKELYNAKKETNIFDVFFTPFFKFIFTYIFKGGFLDGIQGFIYSFLMSFHSFLVRAKLYSKYL